MTSRHTRLAVLFFTVLVIQMICVYLRDLWIIGDSFLIIISLARTVIPLGLNGFYLKFPLTRMGLQLPKMNRKEFFIYASLPLLILVLVGLVHFSSSYLTYYNYMRQNTQPFSVRFERFTWFTLSTIPAWEFLNRGFLLFGLRNLLEGEFKLKTPDVWAIAIPIVCSFEVLYHFQKPAPEPLGLLLASPIFCWIALRTESIVVPLVLHLIIETAFFFAVTS